MSPRVVSGRVVATVMNSLRARLLAATAVLLLAFIVLTGVALETAVSERADQAEHDRLQGLSYALLGSAEITEDGGFKLAPRVLPESDLTRPDSGLYAMVLDENGQAICVEHGRGTSGQHGAGALESENEEDPHGY